MKKNIRVLAFLTIAVWIVPGSRGPLAAQTADAGSQSIAKRIGTIKTLSGTALTLAPSSGPEVAVTVQPAARILRLAPGERELKNAMLIQVQDLQVGDTIRVRGTASEDGKSFNALEVIVITRAAVAAVSDQIRQDWQKRGVGGRVDSVDIPSGNVNLSIPSLAGKKTLVVHTDKSTVVRRYAPDSPKPEDAKSSTLQEIQPGDQLRARGNRNADGTELKAEEVFAGVFPQFAATVKSVDATSGTLSVLDLASKKLVQVKVTADSQLHKIPSEIAQMFAMRLKGTIPPGMPGAGSGAKAVSSPPTNGGSANGSPANGAPAGSPTSGPTPDRAMGGGTRSNGPPDLQRVLSRLPSSTLADLNLQKGDAVIILTTEGTAGSGQTAITLLSGVEPILQAAPTAGQAMMLTPWSLGGAPGGDASQ